MRSSRGAVQPPAGLRAGRPRRDRRSCARGPRRRRSRRGRSPHGPRPSGRRAGPRGDRRRTARPCGPSPSRARTRRACTSSASRSSESSHGRLGEAELAEQVPGRRGQDAVGAGDGVAHLVERGGVDRPTLATSGGGHAHVDALRLADGLDGVVHDRVQVAQVHVVAQRPTTGRGPVAQAGGQLGGDVRDPAGAELPGVLDPVGDRGRLAAGGTGELAQLLADGLGQHRSECGVGAGQLGHRAGECLPVGLGSTVDGTERELRTEVDEQLVAARGDAVAQRLDRVGGADLVGTHLGAQRGQRRGRVGGGVAQVGRTIGTGLGRRGRPEQPAWPRPGRPPPRRSAARASPPPARRRPSGCPWRRRRRRHARSSRSSARPRRTTASLVVCAARLASVGALATPTSTNCSMPRPPCSGEPNSRSWVSIQRTGLANCQASSSISSVATEAGRVGLPVVPVLEGLTEERRVDVLRHLGDVVTVEGEQARHQVGDVAPDQDRGVDRLRQQRRRDAPGSRPTPACSSEEWNGTSMPGTRM